MRLPSSVPDRADVRWAIVIATGHLAVALVCIHVLGVRIGADSRRSTWDSFMQNVPMDLLRNDFVRSIWYFHGQPPLYNVLGGVLGKLFFPHHLQALHAVHVLMGSLICGMSYLVIAQLVPHRAVAVVLASLIAVHPSLYLYEAYILYSLATAFLVVLTAFTLAWHRATGSSVAVHAFIPSVTLLILTRSVYHVIFLAPALLVVACLATGKARRPALAIGALMSLLVVGWCAKNYALVGVFGTSSWFGTSLWKIAGRDYTPSDLARLGDLGIVPPMIVQYPRWGHPSQYRAYGFVATSTIPVLARDNHHNINDPAIARAYGSAARRLIWHDPARYARRVFRAYVIFCRPSSRFEHLVDNAGRLRVLDAFYSDILQGRGRWLVVLLPMALLLHAGRAAMRLGRDRLTLGSIVRSDPVMTWCFVVIVYTTTVYCLFDYGDQARYKFDVEPLLWIFIPVVLLRAGAGIMRQSSRSGTGMESRHAA